MIKIEKINVFNFDGAIRGARNPMNSWDRSDSYFMPLDEEDFNKYKAEGIIPKAAVYDRNWPTEGTNFVIGANDMKLMKSLVKAGSDHRKFMRQIFVSMDITAPLYWWKEFDTYKVGTTSNSCSTMHKIHAKEFSRDDFSCDRMSEDTLACLDTVIDLLEKKRQHFVETKERQSWDDMIQLLPSSYNQMRTVTMNYENCLNMYYARHTHKLPEWHFMCDEIYLLPYFSKICLEE